MTVSDCIERFLNILNKDKEITTDDAIKFYNIVESELSIEYFPLQHEEFVNSNTKLFENFDRNPCRIIECQCGKYKIHAKHIQSKNSNKILGLIKYNYLPKQKVHIEDTSEYDIEYLDCIVHGMLAEYYLTIGDFDTSVIYNDKYKNGVRDIYTKNNKIVQL